MREGYLAIWATTPYVCRVTGAACRQYFTVAT
jgi:hypothetical protein